MLEQLTALCCTILFTGDGKVFYRLHYDNMVQKGQSIAHTLLSCFATAVKRRYDRTDAMHITGNLNMGICHSSD